METRVVGPKEFALMLGVSDKTAAVHMRNQHECINVGLRGQKYLRLPLEVAEEIVAGIRPLSPLEQPDERKPAPPARRPPRGKKVQGPRYVEYR